MPDHDWPGVNEATKYVVSNTPRNPRLKKLEAQNGPDLQVYSSSNLIQTLLKNDLADKLWLKIFPIMLGQGKRLFAEGTIPAAFKLIESQNFPWRRHLRRLQTAGRSQNK